MGSVPQEAQAAAPVPGWGDSVMIESLDSAEADYPFIAADASGNAFAVWDQHDGYRNNVFANRYVAGAGWTGAASIDSVGTDNCYNPRVAFDASGNAIAVWQRYTSSVSSVWASRYVPGEGWGAAELIEGQADEAGLAQVVVDGSGNATAVWSQFKDGYGHIWSNRYVAGDGWGVEEEAEQYVESAYSLDVAVDGAGCVVAVWCQVGVSAVNVSANRYVPGEGWGTAVTIGGNATGDVSEPKVAVGPSGDATAVWYQYDLGDGLYSIWSNRYTVGEGWGEAEILEDDDSYDASGVRVACDGAGNALAVWQQADAGIASIWSNLYVHGEGWGTAGTVEDSDDFATLPRVVFDGTGNGTALWEQWDGERRNICSGRYLAGEGWMPMELASTTGNQSSVGVDAALDGSGNVFAAWLQFDGLRYNVWANMYTVPDTTPPHVSISSPADGTTVDVPAITVSGTAEPGASLTVNGMSAVVEADGSFSCVVLLEEGENTVTATAVDLWSNSANASVTVTYVDPLAAVEAELADALAQIDALQADLDAALADLADLQAQLDAAEDDVASLEAQLAAAEAALLAAEDELADALADLAEVEAQLDDSEADILSLQFDLAAAVANMTSAEADLAGAEQELAEVEEQLAAAEDDLDASDTMNVLLIAGLVGTLAVAAVMALMYMRLRGKGDDKAG
ncbi:MAG: hypothetical protein AB1793_01950 [Candidatus Thermoplasmatota archaeon]